jgi:glutaredoxin-like YruB-family protein
MKSVAIYTTPTCGYCKMAKEFFQENKVEYAEHNVATDEERRNEMIEKTGQMGVPVIMINDEGQEPEVVIGFDKPRLTELLGL